MDRFQNGMAAALLWRCTWQKSVRSNPSGNCVEMAELPTGEIAMRNSRHPDGPALIYTRAEIEAFINGAKDGDFDDLLRTVAPTGDDLLGSVLPTGDDLIGSIVPND